MTNQLGPLLRRLRKQAAMTQQELAEAAKVSVRTINRLETDEKTKANLTTVKLVADALAEGLGRERDTVLRDLMTAHETAGQDADGTPPAPDDETPKLTTADGSASPGALPYRGLLVTYAESLASAVYDRWTRDDELRRLHDPVRFSISWRPVPTRPAERSPAVPAQDGLAEIANAYRSIKSGRLLIAGRAGSGKTYLAQWFVLEYLRTRRAGEPVPVLFSIGTWDPDQTGLRDWLLDRLLQDHPDLGAQAPGGGVLAARLIEAGWVLPVLDGFDEITERLRKPALRLLNATSMPLVLTSRSEAFATTGGRLAAAGIELTDLYPAGLARYLADAADGETTSESTSSLWDPVLAKLIEHPDEKSCANLSAVLSTPLMAMLARTAYNGTTQRNPDDLLNSERFPTQTDLEDHLLADFVPTVYRPTPPPRRRNSGTNRPSRVWDPDRSRRYLAHLAGTPAGRTERDGQDLAWWRLGLAVGPVGRILATVLACAVVTAAAVALIALSVGLVSGFRGGAGATLLDAALFAPAVGLSFGLIHTALVVSGRAEFEPVRLRLRFSRHDRDPARVAWRRFLSWSSAGALIGSVSGLGYGPAVVAERMLLSGRTIHGGQTVRATVIDMFMFALIFGLAGAVVLGVTTLFQAPLDAASAATPMRLLSAERGIVVRLVLFFAPMLACTVALGGLVITGLFQGILGPLQWPLGNGFLIGGIAGITAAGCYALTLTAWGQWVLLARIWLPAAGKLPWAVTDFLQDAYRRGVLRQAGGVYQFRHARLRESLAAVKSERPKR